MSTVFARLAKFARAERGSIAITAALIAPVLLLLVGGTIDYALLTHQRSTVQAATDAAALTAAKDLSLANSKNSNLSEVANSVASSYVRQNTSSQGKLSVNTRLSSRPTEITVSATLNVSSPFGGAFGLFPQQISATSVARVIGKPNICLLGLNSSDGGTITLDENARIEGNNCAVFSNSTHGDSIKSKKTSHLKAQTICSSGGYEGGKENFAPLPYVDCPTFHDPLSSRAEPKAENCTSKEKLVIEHNTNLLPGTYCGGIEIKAGARVDLGAGVYTIRSGELNVLDNSQLIGNGVAIFFTGKGSKMMFDRDTTISLTAPETGAMAGLLLFASRSVGDETFKILSNNTRTLLGTIYLPSSQFYVETEQPVADKSAYTAVVANTIYLLKEPKLILNANYDETNVPVPNGIEGAGQPVALVQ